jgi:hypothetical protein
VLVHRKALVTKERLSEAHARERERGLSFDQIQQIKVFVVNCARPPRPGSRYLELKRSILTLTPMPKYKRI